LHGHGLWSDQREVVPYDELTLFEVSANGVHPAELLEDLTYRDNTALAVQRGNIQNDGSRHSIPEQWMIDLL